MGHILLKKWEYPFVENEELVDEFATVVLMMFNQNQIAEAQAEFFATVPPEQELAKKTDSDDHHPLSAQRARNIRRILKSPDTVKKWQPLLAPHMQTTFLKLLSTQSGYWIDRTLITKELAERKS